MAFQYFCHEAIDGAADGGDLLVADAATSVLAIIALFGGKLWGASWLDPTMGVVGAGLVPVWAYGLLRDSSKILLDAEMDAPIVSEIRESINAASIQAELTDLHVWRIAKEKYACIVSLCTNGHATPDDFRQQIAVHEEVVHITIEINPELSQTSPFGRLPGEHQ